jgi:hypothetical protein
METVARDKLFRKLCPLETTQKNVGLLIIKGKECMCMVACEIHSCY